MEIKLYGAPWCSHCTKLKTDLVKNPFKLPYIYINVDKLSGQDLVTFYSYDIKSLPAIVIVSDNKIKKFDEDFTIDEINTYIENNNEIQ